ncbi:MAG: hypothetical protein C7B46_15455 [Sulfobacillus benefaciens]|uniref:Uncharacterized protein n=1 Tax=Sulfobacillus benefaciens TaxID=453960 RepID=A0A2T2XCK3_9FIRM|nr:MAG: hypothetical protein C7B46_15455 [Sulfobacillus benefaciens]
MFLTLIPYITCEGDHAEVWIDKTPSAPASLRDIQAVLARFATEAFEDGADAVDLTHPEHLATIADHCALWRADRILVPDDSGEAWRALDIDALLSGTLQEAQ